MCLPAHLNALRLLCPSRLCSTNYANKTPVSHHCAAAISFRRCCVFRLRIKTGSLGVANDSTSPTKLLSANALANAPLRLVVINYIICPRNRVLDFYYMRVLFLRRVLSGLERAKKAKREKEKMRVVRKNVKHLPSTRPRRDRCCLSRQRKHPSAT